MLQTNGAGVTKTFCVTAILTSKGYTSILYDLLLVYFLYWHRTSG